MPTRFCPGRKNGQNTNTMKYINIKIEKNQMYETTKKKKWLNQVLKNISKRKVARSSKGKTVARWKRLEALRPSACMK